MRRRVLAALCAGALLLFRDGLAATRPEAAADPHSVMHQIQTLAGEGRFSEAETTLRRLLRDVESQAGPRSLELARVLDLFVETRLKEGKAGHSETLDMARQAVNIKEGIQGLDPGDVAVSLNNLSLVLYSTGHASAGNRHYRYMLEKREKDLGPESADVALTMTSLALSLVELGKPGEARSVLERALAIQRKSAPSAARARTLCLLSLSDRKLGDEIAARRESDAAVAVYEEVFDADESGLAVVLADWAGFLIRADACAEAVPLLNRALHLWQKHAAAGDLFSGRCAALLGDVYRRSGDDRGARASYETALRILGASSDVDPAERADLFSSAAGVLSRTGAVSEAESLYERSAGLYLETAGPASIDGARALIQKARALAGSSRPEAAIAAALRADELTRRSQRLVAMALPENRALEMAPVRPSGLEVALSLCEAGPGTASTRDVFDAVIRNRALVLDEVAARYHTIRDVESPGTVRLFDAFTAASQAYSRQALRGGDDGNSPELEAGRRARDDAEAALAARSLVFRRARARSLAGLVETLAALPPGDALAAFVRFDRDAFAGDAPVPSYAAFVIPSGGRSPVFLRLGEAAAIEDLVKAWKREAAIEPLSEGTPSESRYRAAGENLRRRIWDPIIAKTGGANRLFIVPDGEIHQVSFAALPVARGRYVIEAGPVIHYLSSERDLVASGILEEPGRDLLAVGAASFDAGDPGGSSPGGSSAEPGVAAAWTMPRPFRGPGPGCESFQSIRFEPLPASRREIEDIAAIWRMTAGRPPNAILLSGAEARESAFKRSAPEAAILHLATHGFVLGGECLTGDSRTRGIGRMSADAGPTTPENPLRLSGLALAGANQRMSVGPGEEDGILTAEEIAALDLSGVEWAVLSACDTGLGEVRTGEGVFGLRRAFEVAGVETLIMSLWAVEDDASSRWMKNLYEARFLRKLDTAHSVRDASLRMLDERRKSKLSAHPFFWGGFVATGEWR